MSLQISRPMPLPPPVTTATLPSSIMTASFQRKQSAPWRRTTYPVAALCLHDASCQFMRTSTGHEEFRPVPFLDTDHAIAVRRGLELRPVRFLGDKLQNARAFIFADEDGVDGHAELFGQLAFSLHLPIPLRRHAVREEKDVLVPRPQTLKLRESVFQRVLIIRTPRAVQMQRPLRHFLVVADEELPTHLILGREVVELDVAHPHALLSGHFYEPEDHR